MRSGTGCHGVAVVAIVLSLAALSAATDYSYCGNLPFMKEAANACCLNTGTCETSSCNQAVFSQTSQNTCNTIKDGCPACKKVEACPSGSSKCLCSAYCESPDTDGNCNGVPLGTFGFYAGASGNWKYCNGNLLVDPDYDPCPDPAGKTCVNTRGTWVDGGAKLCTRHCIDTAKITGEAPSWVLPAATK